MTLPTQFTYSFRFQQASHHHIDNLSFSVGVSITDYDAVR